MFYCYHGIMHDIIFREYQDKDKQSVSTFLRRIFAEMGWTVTPEDHIDTPKDYFYRDGGFLFVAKDNEQVVGTAGILPLKKTANLKRFYIDSNYRGKGIAQQFFSRIKEAVKSKGYNKIILDVGKVNERARRFYEKQGFVQSQVPLYDLTVSSLHPGDFCFYELDL